MTNLSTESQWYVATSFSGNEQKVVDSIINNAKSASVYGTESNDPRVESVRILTEKIKRTTPTGIEKEVEKNIFQGYIFIKMIMDDETWFMVRNTPGVTGFVGSSGKGAKPFPITDFEIETLLENAERNAALTEEEIAKPIKVVYETSLTVGDDVEVIDGPFSGQTGTIVSLDTSKGLANISVEFFGRLTNVEIAFKDIKKPE